MNIDTGIDLIQFIDNERKPGKILKHKKAYIYFNTCLLKTIIELSAKFRDNMIEVVDNTIIGVNTFCHVFFVLLAYTNNLKLTIFLAERAVLLYTEFIIMSKEAEEETNLRYNPTNKDAMLFSYKKTIGPIKLNDISNNTTMRNIKFTGTLVKQLYLDFFKKREGNISLDDFKSLDSIFSNIFIKLSDKTEGYEETEPELRGYLIKKIWNWLNYKPNIYKSYLLTKCVLETIVKMKINIELISNFTLIEFTENATTLECLHYYRETDFYKCLTTFYSYENYENYEN